MKSTSSNLREKFKHLLAISKMKSTSANLREKFKHLLAISKMSIEEKVLYLEEMEIAPHVDRSGIWCGIALRVAADHGRLPDHLHNRFLMEVGSEDLKRGYLELL